MAAGPRVTINGEQHQLRAGATVADVVRTWSPSPDGIAVARNGDVVPRSAWAVTSLEGGDRVEIVTAAAGG
ncbi:MAG: sulfur carrier protein ThiS [Acidimicrobiales bacterium]